jgi:hypothetical protein
MSRVTPTNNVEFNMLLGKKGKARAHAEQQVIAMRMEAACARHRDFGFATKGGNFEEHPDTEGNFARRLA